MRACSGPLQSGPSGIQRSPFFGLETGPGHDPATDLEVDSILRRRAAVWGLGPQWWTILSCDLRSGESSGDLVRWMKGRHVGGGRPHTRQGQATSDHFRETILKRLVHSTFARRSGGQGVPAPFPPPPQERRKAGASEAVLLLFKRSGVISLSPVVKRV